MESNPHSSNISDSVVNRYIDDAQQSCLAGNYSLALKLLIKACEIDPNHDIAQTNLSYLAYLTGDFSLAIAAGKQAVLLNPERAEAHLNLGNALRSKGEVEAAIKCLEIALTKNPELAEAWNNLNLAYQDCGRITEALAAGKKALSLNKRLMHGYNNLAIALQNSGDALTAHELLKIAIKLYPNSTLSYSNYLMNLQYINSFSSQGILQETRKFGKLFLDPKIKKLSIIKGKNKLKIGYISADFRCHPVGFFLLPLLSKHHKNQVEIFLYANQHLQDHITQQIQETTNHWRNVVKLTDEQVAQQIKSDKIDILVDLSGHTAGNRLGVFSLRPAPVQVSWLGYFGSTGLGTMDYVILSEDQAPEGSENFFTEQLYRLPGCQFCYSPPPYAPNLKSPPHLSKGYITFGSFNNIAKINSEVIALWSSILQQLPNSKLVLKWKSFQDLQLRQQFYQRFAHHGIVKERIEMRGYSPHPEMFEEYNDIDIALDTFPFSGALTTCEALWMGVPVITLFQQRPVSRQTFSILKSIQLDRLATKTPKAYLTTAVELAQDTDTLAVLRTEIRQRMNETRNTQSQILAANLEQAFWQIFESVTI